MEISSRRLNLQHLDPAAARSIVDGSGRLTGAWHPEYPLADELDPLRSLMDSTEPPSPFRLYRIRLRDSGLAVGGIGFFGPQDADGFVELGYGLVKAVRGRGLATEAVLRLLDFALQNGAVAVKADTDAANLASQRVLTKAGFREVDRSGAVVFFQRDL
jgi:RimJ/RimL family protein N-acetyltransferase